MRVSPGGVKTFFYTYKFEGRKRRMTLGQYPGVRLAIARRMHRDALDLRQQGKDPAEVNLNNKSENLRALTIELLGNQFIEEYCKLRKKSWKEDRRILKTYIYPEWKKKKAKNISKREVVELVDLIAKSAPIQANRVLACVKKMYSYAVEKSIVEVSPCISVKPPSKEKEKNRNLSVEEIKIFFDKVETAAMCNDLKRVLKLILVTGQRPGEIVGAHSSEIDGSWWTIPKERMKNGLEHRVYLTRFAIELFGKKSGFIFESPKKNRPISVNAISRAVRNNAEHFGLPHWTPHDLRRTAATKMASNGHGKFVDKVLSHKNSSVTGKYDKYEYDLEKKAALLSLEGFLLDLINNKEEKGGGKVIYFPSKK